VIEEKKTREINEPCPAWCFLGSEKDRGREDTLKSRDQALVVWPILGEAKEIEHLGRRIEMDCPVLLLKSEGRNPDGNWAVLPKRQTEVGMRGDVQEELATMACMNQLGFGRSPEREPAKHEGPGVEGEGLLMILSLFANKLDGIELFESTFRDSKNGGGPLKTINDVRKTVALLVLGFRAGCIMGCIVVPELEPRVRMRAIISD
jgi:hypothetical protein